MTLFEIIEQVDKTKPNNYSREDKIKWLSDLDCAIKTEIIDTHEGEALSFAGYDADTPGNTELLVPSPYDVVYIAWLESRIDYTNGEINKYNNSNAVFLTAYSAFERYYNRTHMPSGTSFRYF